MQAIASISAVNPAVAAASEADLQTVQGAAAMAVMRKSVNMSAMAAAELLAALPAIETPQLASDGPVGTQLHEVA